VIGNTKDLLKGYYLKRIQELKRKINSSLTLKCIFSSDWFEKVENKINKIKKEIEFEYCLPYTFRFLENNKRLKKLDIAIKTLKPIIKASSKSAKINFENTIKGLVSFNYQNNKGSLFEIFILYHIAVKYKNIILYPSLGKKHSDARFKFGRREVNVEITHISLGKYKERLIKMEKELKSYVIKFLPRGYRCSITLNDEFFIKNSSGHLSERETLKQICEMIDSKYKKIFVSLINSNPQVIKANGVISKISLSPIRHHRLISIVDIQYAATTANLKAMRKEIHRNVVDSDKMAQLDPHRPNLLFLSLGLHADYIISKFTIPNIFKTECLTKQISAVVIFNTDFQYCGVIFNETFTKGREFKLHISEKTKLKKFLSQIQI